MHQAQAIGLVVRRQWMPISVGAFLLCLVAAVGTECGNAKYARKKPIGGPVEDAVQTAEAKPSAAPAPIKPLTVKPIIAQPTALPPPALPSIRKLKRNYTLAEFAALTDRDQYQFCLAWAKNESSPNDQVDLNERAKELRRYLRTIATLKRYQGEMEGNTASDHLRVWQNLYDETWHFQAAHPATRGPDDEPEPDRPDEGDAEEAD